jgi:hypothetical protein
MSFLKEPGFIVVIIALVIFYFRIIQLRGRKRKLERKMSLARLKNPNKKKAVDGKGPNTDPNKPPFAVTSWVLVIFALVLMLVGTAIKTSLTFIPVVENYWWVPTTLGILLFVFCFKVEA